MSGTSYLMNGRPPFIKYDVPDVNCFIILVTEMYDYTSNNWSYWNSNEQLRETFGSCTRKTFDRFTKKTAILGTAHIIRKVLQCEA
jgi:hypothetical protein